MATINWMGEEPTLSECETRAIPEKDSKVGPTVWDGASRALPDHLKAKIAKQQEKTPESAVEKLSKVLKTSTGVGEMGIVWEKLNNAFNKQPIKQPLDIYTVLEIFRRFDADSLSVDKLSLQEIDMITGYEPDDDMTLKPILKKMVVFVHEDS